MRLVIHGNPVSQKNSKNIVTNHRTGRPIIISSKNVQSWHKNAKVELLEQINGRSVENYPVSVSMILYYNNKRARDLDNSSTSVLDALVKSGILVDDNYNYINRLVVEYGGVDRDNPRTEIQIEPNGE